MPTARRHTFHPLYHPETLRRFRAENAAVSAAGGKERLRLRPLEIIPFSSGGQPTLLLRDPSGIAASPLAVTPAAIPVLRLLDGRLTREQVISEVTARSGGAVGPQVQALLRALDEHYLLEDSRFRQRVIDVVAEFARARRRDPIAMGRSYPADGAATRNQIQSYLAAAGEAAGPPARALIAPHIDYPRGHATYARAYRRLRGTRAKRFVVLGTAHQPSEHFFAATTKTYWTSLGDMPVDRDFLARLARRYPFPLYADEFLHRGEHSIELELPFIQVLAPAGAKLVPILCGSLHRFLAPGAPSPRDEPEIRSFISALVTTIRESPGETVLIAAADLSHQGAQFGDTFRMTDERLAALRAADGELLDRIAARDAAGFIAALARTRNAQRVCGVAPIYTLLRVLDALETAGSPHLEATIEGYDQCTDAERLTTVTIPAVAFDVKPRGHAEASSTARIDQ